MGCDHEFTINRYFMLLAPVILRSNVGDGNAFYRGHKSNLELIVNFIKCQLIQH